MRVGRWMELSLSIWFGDVKECSCITIWSGRDCWKASSRREQSKGFIWHEWLSLASSYIRNVCVRGFRCTSATFLRYPITRATAFWYSNREIELVAAREDKSRVCWARRSFEIFSSPFPSDWFMSSLINSSLFSTFSSFHKNRTKVLLFFVETDNRWTLWMNLSASGFNGVLLQTSDANPNDSPASGWQSILNSWALQKHFLFSPFRNANFAV